jgi:hypothetical protein
MSARFTEMLQFLDMLGATPYIQAIFAAVGIIVIWKYFTGSK